MGIRFEYIDHDLSLRDGMTWRDLCPLFGVDPDAKSARDLLLDYLHTQTVLDNCHFTMDDTLVLDFDNHGWRDDDWWNTLDLLKPVLSPYAFIHGDAEGSIILYTPSGEVDFDHRAMVRAFVDGLGERTPDDQSDVTPDDSSVSFN